MAARRPAKASGWRLFVRTALARAYPRVIGGNREKSWVFFEVVLPLLALSAYVFVYRGLQAPEEFVGFVILGGAMSAFWLHSMALSPSSTHPALKPCFLLLRMRSRTPTRRTINALSKIALEMWLIAAVSSRGISRSRTSMPRV